VKIYKAFVKQTDQAVRFLSTARHFEHATRLEIPKIKHAPTSLASSLEDYLNDPEFEAQRREYLAQQESHKKGKAVNGKALAAKPSTTTNGLSNAKANTSRSSATAEKPQPKGPAPDLIDFFESIEQHQQPMAQPAYQQPQYGQVTAPGSMPQQAPYVLQEGIQTQSFGPVPIQNTNPFLQMQQPQVQPNLGGVPYPGVGQQNRFTSTLSSIPQSSVASFPAQAVQPFPPSAMDAAMHSTNPFRQSMLMSSGTGASSSSFGSGTTINTAISSQATNTNPFSKSSTPSTPQMSPFSPSPFSQPNNQAFSPVNSQPSPFGQMPQVSQVPQATSHAAAGTNPFAKAAVQPGQNTFSQAPIVSQATGSTNPFRQSTFVNPNTGTGWQNSGHGTIGGMSSDRVETVPVFPRPGMG
jgi:phosphatidylinositol-binding clathrin assembly protein